MHERELEQRLNRAVTNTTPDVWDKILLGCEKQKGEQMTETAQVAAFEQQADTKKKVAWGKFAGVAAAAVAALVMVFAGVNYYTVDSVIGIDVNPSIQLETNMKEEVLNAVPLNEDAQVILGEMDLKGVDLDVAVNALIGSMMKHGYVSEMKNSILVSVENSDSTRGQVLEERISADIEELMKGYALDGAVLSQTLPEDQRLQDLAAQYGISLGKATLIDTMVSADSRLNFAELAGLSINDLNLILASKNTDFPGVSSTGQANSGAYIGEDKAKEAALAHAGVTAADVAHVQVEMDADDGRMVYDVEFVSGGIEYEYEVDATSGDIVRYETEDKTGAQHSGQAGAAMQQTGVAQDYIGEEQAKSAALAHAGLAGADATLIKIKLDDDDGRAVYDVEFYAGNTEYDYEVDAVSGEVLQWDQDVENYNISQSGVAPNASSGSTAFQDGTIGESDAKSAALAHAGLAEKAVSGMRCKLDHDDGRTVYDVEFHSGTTKYEYEIDASNGTVLDFDIDHND